MRHPPQQENAEAVARCPLVVLALPQNLTTPVARIAVAPDLLILPSVGVATTLHHEVAAAHAIRKRNAVETPAAIDGIPGHLYRHHEVSVVVDVVGGGMRLPPVTVEAGVVVQVEVLATVLRLFIDSHRRRQSKTLRLPCPSLAMGRRKGRATRMLMGNFPM